MQKLWRNHGEMMGSHALFGKYLIYEESFCVPFMVRFPGKIQNRVFFGNYVLYIIKNHKMVGVPRTFIFNTLFVVSPHIAKGNQGP